MWRKFLLPIIILVSIIQLFVPASMVWNSEKTLRGGELHKFATQPVDPDDPIRGKYVTLRFAASEITDSTKKYQLGKDHYAVLQKSKDGFTTVSKLTLQKPDHPDYVKVRLQYVSSKTVRIRFPFNRFYMNENLAPKAEALYRKYSRESNQNTYALVRIQNGQYVLEDLIINGKPVLELIEESER